MMKRRCGMVAVALGVALALIGPASSPAAAEPPSFSVSVASLGVEGGRMEAAEFVNAMNAGGWCRASAAPATWRWDERPASVPAGEWLSVVLAGFGEQAEAFAFMADGPAGGLRLVGHVSYRKTFMPGGAMVWVPPAGRLAAAVRDEYARSRGAGGAGEPVGYRVLEWARPAAALSTAGGLAGLLDERMTEDAAAPTVTFGDGAPALEALFVGALCRNGWAPVRTGAAGGFALEVRFGYQSAAARIVRTGGGAPVERQTLDIHEDHYFGSLRRLIQPFREPRIADFVRLGSAPVSVLAATSNRLCVVADGEMKAYDPRSGRRVWPEQPAEPPARRSAPPPHAVRVSEAGVSTVYLTAKGLSVLDLETGVARSLAPETPATPESFGIGKDGLVVVAAASGLAAFRDGALVWRREDFGGLTAAPLVVADRVFVSRGDGLLACLAAGDGTEIWRATGGGDWLGGWVSVGDRVIGFCRKAESLVGVSAADGAVLWRQPVGDVLLKEPIAVGGRLLAAGKNNRLLLLDPATGRPAAETVWPTWLVDVRAIPGPSPRIVCTDIGGRLTDLDAATLKPVRSLALPARPVGRLAFAPRFPLVWGAGRGAGEGMEDLFGGETGPALLAPDADGYCTIVREAP